MMQSQLIRQTGDPGSSIADPFHHVYDVIPQTMNYISLRYGQKCWLQ